MTKDEALHLALEALEGVLDDSPKVLDASISGDLYEVVQCRDAITAIKEALAQEQEPVGKFAKFTDGIWREVTDGSAGVPLYTTPLQRTWVGLTRMELIGCGVLPWGMSYKLYKAIEAKIKEKNT